MTYYSDLLTVVDEVDALKHGIPPRHSAAALRRLCRNILAIDPDEDVADQLLLALRDLDDEIEGDSIRIFLFDEFRSQSRVPPTAH